MPVTGRLLLTGKLKLISPLIIGGDGRDEVDIQALRDVEGNPYIPGTSLCGALRHCFEEITEENWWDSQSVEYFWGSAFDEDKDQLRQSAIIISDCFINPANEDQYKIVIRNGVKIDDLGVADEQKKYEYEVVEPDVTFDFRAEIKIWEEHKENFYIITAFILNSLQNGKVNLGAMTTKGLGRCRLEEAVCWEYDFSNKHDVLNWLAGTKEEQQRKNLGIAPELNNNRDLELIGTFGIKNSLLIKSYSGDSTGADAVHITSNNCPVLPGTSLKGVIRNRMQRILNTLKCADTKGKLQNLCGSDSSLQKGNNKKHKSRLIVEETKIHDITIERQSRIAIDRFTGGTLKTALYNCEPLWPVDGKKEMTEIKLCIKNCRAWEAGLLLLVLKDLWTGDLPIGGEKSIGRGTLTGISAEIRFDNKVYTIGIQDNGLKITGDQNELERFVLDLRKECGKEEQP